MAKILRITRPEGPLRGKIRLPASKSISNRLLMMEALSGGDFGIKNLSNAGDSVLLQKLLSKIKGIIPGRDTVEIDCADAGTVIRFLAVFLAIRPGRWVLTGTDRMKQRPIGALAESLKTLGASIQYLGSTGFPPLLIEGKSLQGGELHIQAGISSQFISALMMAGPYVGPMILHLEGDIVSEPYIEMTARLMRECGATLKKSERKIVISPGTYTCNGIEVEPDWSSASFWYLAAALSSSADLEFPGLFRKSIQGDSILPELFQPLGIKTRVSPSGIRIGSSEAAKWRSSDIGHPHILDFTNHPDLALPVIAGYAAMGLNARFEGLKSLLIKESDRVNALVAELGKLGCGAILEDDGGPVISLPQSGIIQKRDTVIETYRDHRMAMTFAMLSMATGSIRISDPDVVEKSYPGFWADLHSAGFGLE